MSQMEIFDYTQLDTKTASDIKGASERINLRLRKTAEDIVAIGQDLISVKERLGHGNFLEWITAEFNMSQSTASRFMTVAEAFEGKLPTVGNLTPTVLYELAAPSTPEPVRQQMLEKAESGEKVSVKEVQEWRQKTKELEKREKEARQRLDESNKQVKSSETRLRELANQLSKLKVENDRLASQEPEIVEQIIEKIPEEYLSLEEAIATQQTKLDELRKEADKEAKRLKQRKTAHENRLKDISQEIADKDPVVESVRTARFFAQQYKELTNKYIQQLIAIGFEAWIEGDHAAPSDAAQEIDETCKWLLGRTDKYLLQISDKQGTDHTSQPAIDVITVEAMAD
ncbi:MAG: DUF3102 domain-containing protein [Cyanobacteria bacterium P01_E01_bin.6]